MIRRGGALLVALAGLVAAACSIEEDRDREAFRSWGDGQFCGGIAGIPCPAGSSCIDDPSDDCSPKTGGADCSGICVGPPTCGGFANLGCPRKRQVCVDDPSDDCDPDDGGADCSGICILPVACGGIAGIPCAEGFICEDDPRDDCDPNDGGADCGGLCVPDPYACVGDLCEF